MAQQEQQNTDIIQVTQEEIEEARKELQNLALEIPGGSQIIVSDEVAKRHAIEKKKPAKTWEEIKQERMLESVIEKTLETNGIKLHIDIWMSNYGQFLHYRLWTDQPANYDNFEGHPFRYLLQDESEEVTETSEVVADNGLMRKLFQYIAKEDEDLSLVSGSRQDAAEYRARLIHTLSFLQDD